MEDGERHIAAETGDADGGIRRTGAAAPTGIHVKTDVASAYGNVPRSSRVAPSPVSVNGRNADDGRRRLAAFDGLPSRPSSSASSLGRRGRPKRFATEPAVAQHQLLHDQLEADEAAMMTLMRRGRPAIGDADESDDALSESDAEDAGFIGKLRAAAGRKRARARNVSQAKMNAEYAAALEEAGSTRSGIFGVRANSSTRQRKSHKHLVLANKKRSALFTLQLAAIDAVLSNTWAAVMAVVIFTNAVLIGLQVDDDAPMEDPAPFFRYSEHVFTVIFVTEQVIKIFALRKEAFESAFDYFDFVIAVVAAMDVWVLSALDVQSSGSSIVTPLRVLRMLRVARVLRLIAFFESLHVLVMGLLTSLGPLFWVSCLLTMFLYLFAVMMTILIGRAEIWEGDERIELWFGSTGKSLFTLFQITTFEGWPEISRHVMTKQPAAWILFVLFLMVAVFACLNLITGVIVEKTLAASRDIDKENVSRRAAEKEALRKKLVRLFAVMDTSRDGSLDLDEMRDALGRQEVTDILESLGVRPEDVVEIHSILDLDGDGRVSFSEFCMGLTDMNEPTKQMDILVLQVMVLRMFKALRRSLSRDIATKVGADTSATADGSGTDGRLTPVSVSDLIDRSSAVEAHRRAMGGDAVKIA